MRILNFIRVCCRYFDMSESRSRSRAMLGLGSRGPTAVKMSRADGNFNNSEFRNGSVSTDSSQCLRVCSTPNNVDWDRPPSRRKMQSVTVVRGR